MAYIVQDFRDRIRAHLDLDSTDLSDTLVDEFIRDAAQKLQYSRQTWPFYEETWTFATVASQADYTFAAIEAGHASSYELGEIRMIRGTNRELEPQARLTAHRMNPIGAESTGEPKWWSVWGSTVRLDPIPTTIETLTVEGWRKPKDWVADGAGGASDAPEPFDRVILNWAIGRAYAFQDEPDTSLHFYDLGDLRLSELTKSYDDINPHAEIVMGGGDPRFARPDLALPWE